MEVKRKFGLFTSICMIVGIVIGSGIFFKSDNVLAYTNGNVGLGILVFIIAAFAIVFGSLTLAELAIKSNGKGGIIAYAEEALGKRGALVYGWYQNFIYYPSILAVVAWVTGIYSCILFGITATLELQILIGVMCIFVFYIMNFFSAKLAGIFQNAATIIKLLPILIIAITGIFFGKPDFSSIMPNRTEFVGSWIAAIGPIAFAYDGWNIATSISHEIKNEKRNLPLALIIAPIFILIVYIMYFVGISFIVGPQQIIALGDAHVDVAFATIFGNMGSKLLLVFVIISIMGTINGIVLGSTRSFYVLGLNKMLPFSEKMSQISVRSNTPTVATLFSCCVTLFWMLIHYLTTKFSLLNNSDISEIAIVTMYLLYIVLYIHVIKLWRNKEIKSNLKGLVLPVFAIIGALIVFYGGMQNPMFILYAVVSLLVISLAYLYAKKINI